MAKKLYFKAHLSHFCNAFKRFGHSQIWIWAHNSFYR